MGLPFDEPFLETTGSYTGTSQNLAFSGSDVLLMAAVERQIRKLSLSRGTSDAQLRTYLLPVVSTRVSPHLRNQVSREKEQTLTTKQQHRLVIRSRFFRTTATGPFHRTLPAPASLQQSNR